MGIALSSFVEQSLFLPKPKWDVDNIPDLSGKVVIVTGGNTGCGKETVKALLNHNAKVYLAARSPEKAQRAIEDLQKETKKQAIFLPLDLSDLTAIRRSAEEFLSKEQQLHILFNNAGVMATPMDQFTAQGYDMQIGVNVLGHAYFTRLLLPALFAAGESGTKARVISTSSSVAYMTSTFHFEWATDTSARKKRSPTDLYWDSKLGNAIYARELGRRYGDKIVSVACNPGNLDSELQRHIPSFQRKMMTWLMYPPSFGAITQLYAGTSPEGADYNGKFLVPWARFPKRTPPPMEDKALGAQMWKWLDEQLEKY